MEFVREILLMIEADDAFNGLDSMALGPEHFPDREWPQIHYHLSLLLDAGLLRLGAKAPDGFQYFTGLTWQGHEFVETVRDPEVWRKTKDGARQIGSFSIDLLTDLAKGFLKRKVEDLTGMRVEI
jgi:hypothetical protein